MQSDSLTLNKSLLCLFLSVLSCLAQETPQELEDSRKILFDGQSLENWEITDFAGRGKLDLMEMEVLCLSLALL